MTQPSSATVGALVAIGLLFATPAHAENDIAAALADLTYAVRGSLIAGGYDFEAKRTQRNGGFVQRTEADGERRAYGAGLGALVGGEHVFADISVEYQDVDLFSLTDYSLLVGTYLGEHYSAAVGLRAANQGEDFGDDDFYRERGYFVSIGAGGWTVAQRIGLSGSLAYNRTQIELQPGGRELSADGFSIKLQAALAGTPHAVGVRLREFNADDVLREDEVSVEDELRETYLAAYYQYTWVR